MDKKIAIGTDRKVGRKTQRQKVKRKRRLRIKKIYIRKYERYEKMNNVE